MLAYLDLHNTRDWYMRLVTNLQMSCTMAENESYGTSTLAAVRLLEGKRMDIVNLGDSGVLIFRLHPNKNEVYKIFRTEEQYHTDGKSTKCGNSGQNAEMADDEKVDLWDGDIAVVFTNGVSDNLSDERIKECVEMFLKDGMIMDKKTAASCIAVRSFAASVN